MRGFGGKGMLNSFGVLRVVCNPFTAQRFIVIASKLLKSMLNRFKISQTLV